MEGTASAFRDWVHLPSLVLHLISEKVKSITDYVRFRAVCAPWRSASLAKPGHLPHQLPWLIIPQDLDSAADDGIRLFYDLWQDKMHKIHLPETIGKMCCASYRGWLLLVAPEGTELFLLNPLTRARVELPPFNIPGAHQISYDARMDDFAMTKMTFSADLTDPKCLIMVFLRRWNAILFCHVGDLYWTDTLVHVVGTNHPHSVRNTYLDVLCKHEILYLLRDVAYNNGKFYLLYDGAIFIYDLKQQLIQNTYIFKPQLSADKTKSFFLEGKSGLYIVAVQDTGEHDKIPGQKIELYQVLEQPMEVKHISDTSNTTIFHGDNCNYLAVRADEWDSLNGGCVYIVYMQWNPYVGYNGFPYCYNISFAKLDDGNRDLVMLDLGERKDLPNEWAMWFQPSFV